MDANPSTLIAGSFLFGAAALPLYSVSAAYANDHCPRDFVVELNASLLVLFALGAVLSPTIAAELVALYGPDALWGYIALGHAALIAFGFWRLTVRPTAPAPQPYRSLLRSSTMLGRLLKRRDDDENATAENGSGATPAGAPPPEPGEKR